MAGQRFREAFIDPVPRLSLAAHRRITDVPRVRCEIMA